MSHSQAVQDLRDLDYAPNWASPHPDHCLCGGSGWITSNYDTQHACCFHVDRSGKGPYEPHWDSFMYNVDMNDEAAVEAADAAYSAEMDAYYEAEAVYEAERFQGLYRLCTEYYRQWAERKGLAAEFAAHMSNEDSEAAEGTPCAYANAAQAFYGAKFYEVADREAREAGYSCYSEMLWDY